tara:strand:+ start:377 stop:634 length:258 start_codon:yes stop_codon:yes gene_type:complete
MLTKGPDTRLIHVGHRLAVLGMIAGSKWWHVMSPGTWTAPQIGGAHNAGIVQGRALCRRVASTNGYAADFRPPDDAICPACREQM